MLEVYQAYTKCFLTKQVCLLKSQWPPRSEPFESGKLSDVRGSAAVEFTCHPDVIHKQSP
jgi:hypothetical protein